MCLPRSTPPNLLGCPGAAAPRKPAPDPVTIYRRGAISRFPASRRSVWLRSCLVISGASQLRADGERPPQSPQGPSASICSTARSPEVKGSGAWQGIPGTPESLRVSGWPLENQMGNRNFRPAPNPNFSVFVPKLLYNEKSQNISVGKHQSCFFFFINTSLCPPGPPQRPQTPVLPYRPCLCPDYISHDAPQPLPVTEPPVVLIVEGLVQNSSASPGWAPRP